MKKFILSILGTVIVSTVVGVGTMLNPPMTEKPREQLKQETKIEKVDEKIDTKETAVKGKETKEIEEEKPNKTEKNEKKETKSESTKKPSSSVSNVPKQEAPTKQDSNSKSNNATTSQPSKNTSKNNQQSVNQNNQPSSNTPSNNSTQKNNVSTTFYDSITGGKKEFSSESEAFARGTQIQEKELDYVLDWNEAHPDNQIQPDINYFRVYPSAIDENGKYWYYLHFFCRTGEGNDAKLKSMF